MKIEVKSFPRGNIERTVTLNQGATVIDLLKELNLRFDGWIAVRDEKAIPDDAPLEDGDSIKLLSVVSGG